MSWKCHDTEVIISKTSPHLSRVMVGSDNCTNSRNGDMATSCKGSVWPCTATLGPAGLVSSQLQLCKVWIIPCKATGHSSPLQPQRMVKGGKYHSTNVQSLFLCNATLLSQRKKLWEGSADGPLLLSIWAAPCKSSLEQALEVVLSSLTPAGAAADPARAWLSLGRLRYLQGAVIDNIIAEQAGMWPGKGRLAVWQNDSVITNSFAMDKPPPPSLLATVFSLAGPQNFFLWQKGIQFSPTVVDYHISKSGQASRLKRWTAWHKEGSLCGSVLSYFNPQPLAADKAGYFSSFRALQCACASSLSMDHWYDGAQWQPQSPLIFSVVRLNRGRCSAAEIHSL